METLPKESCWSENENAHHFQFTGVNLIRNEKFVGDKKSTTFIIKLPATSFWWWARGVRWTWGLRWWWTCFSIKIWVQAHVSVDTLEPATFSFICAYSVKMSKSPLGVSVDEKGIGYFVREKK